jgi:hypothetical protein
MPADGLDDFGHKASRLTYRDTQGFSPWRAVSPSKEQDYYDLSRKLDTSNFAIGQNGAHGPDFIHILVIGSRSDSKLVVWKPEAFRK